MDCSPSVHGDSPGKNNGVDHHSLLQGLFPTQGTNPGLPHCRWILYHVGHQGSPRVLKWKAYHFSGDLPNPGIEMGSPALQADSLPAELPGKSFSSNSLGFSVYSIMSSASNDSFTHSLQIWIIVTSFSCLSVLAGLPILQWIEVMRVGILVFFQILTGRLSNFHYSIL